MARQFIHGERTEDYLKNIIQSAADAIFCVGKTQCVVTWNPGAEELLGYRAHEIIGQPADILSPDDNKRLMRSMVIETMEGDALKNLECELMGKNGKVAVYVTASPIKNELMDIVGVSVIAKDVTDQNRLIQAFIKQERNHSHLKGLIETLTTLNHHIRNAVASISLKAEVCRQYDQLEEYRELTETCVRQSKRIAAVLESLHEVVVRAQCMNEDPQTIEISGSPTPQFDIESDLEERLKKIDGDSPNAEA